MGALVPIGSGLAGGSIRVVLGWYTPESQLGLMFKCSTGGAQGRRSGGNCLPPVMVVEGGWIVCMGVTSQLSPSTRCDRGCGVVVAMEVIVGDHCGRRDLGTGVWVVAI